MTLKHATMVLYSGLSDLASHRVRLAIAEKGLSASITYIDQTAPLPESFLAVNPYGILPTLVDRELTIYNPSIISEYLDERFPHPPLLPVYPITKTRCRLIIHRLELDCLPLVDKVLDPKTDPAAVIVARKELYEQIASISQLFNEAPYFLSDEFSLVDCCLAPLLWRLKAAGIKLNNNFKPVIDYMKRVFSRPGFRESLSDQEVEMVADE